MPGKWEEVATKEFAAAEAPVAANASDIAKFGAPLVAFVGLLLAGLLGDEFEFDPKKGETVVAAGIVAAAAILGVLLVYANDFRTRGRVTVARLEALAGLVRDEYSRDAARADLAGCRKELKAEEDRVSELEQAHNTMAAELAEAKEELAACAAKKAALEGSTAETQEPQNGARPVAPESVIRLRGLQAIVVNDTEPRPIQAGRTTGERITAYLLLTKDGRLQWVASEHVQSVRSTA